MQQLARRVERAAGGAVDARSLVGEVDAGHVAVRVEGDAAELHLDDQATVRCGRRRVAVARHAAMRGAAQRHAPLAARLQAIAQARDGLVERADGREVGDQDVEHARPALQAGGTGHQRALGQHAQQISDGGAAARDLLVLGALRRRQHAGRVPARVELGQAALEAGDAQQFAARGLRGGQAQRGAGTGVGQREELEEPPVEVVGAHGGMSCGGCILSSAARPIGPWTRFRRPGFATVVSILCGASLETLEGSGAPKGRAAARGRA